MSSNSQVPQRHLRSAQLKYDSFIGGNTIRNELKDDLLLLDLRATEALCSEVPPNTSHLVFRPEIKVVNALKCTFLNDFNLFIY